MPGKFRASEKAKEGEESENLWRFEMRDKAVQVKLTNYLSYIAIKSSCIDMNLGMTESLDTVLSYAYSSVAIVLLVHKL
jgi:hypothetical protein